MAGQPERRSDPEKCQLSLPDNRPSGHPATAINSGGEQSWKINSDAFGNSELDANNQITMNLRFPGQYYDAETGLSYNYFRDYDAKTGRYIESDPIGLAGGINTYGYVGGNPHNSCGTGAVPPPPPDDPDKNNKSKNSNKYIKHDKMRKEQARIDKYK